jgi:hypothetical protein
VLSSFSVTVIIVLCFIHKSRLCETEALFICLFVWLAVYMDHIDENNCVQVS